jgi:hypothetical protein
MLVASVAIAVGLAVSTAHAVTPDQARAAELKKKGDDAIESGRPAEALDAYVEAYALSKDPALLYNKGRALQALTDYPRAIEELELFDREAPAELKQRARGFGHILEELRSKVTRVAITCPAGATVRLRDRTIGQCPLSTALVVNAGRGRLEVSQEAYVPWTREVDLPGGGTATFDVVLVAKPADRAGAAVVAEAPSPRPSRPLFTQWWFWAGIGVVIAAGAVVAVAATTERSPPQGTVPPGVVVGGLQAGAVRF